MISGCCENHMRCASFLGTIIIMDACIAVEREVDKVLSKFGDIDSQTADSLGDIIQHFREIRKDLENDFNSQLTATQSLLLAQCVKRVKELVSRLSSDHKDLHGSVSKVGKAIDRSFVSDFSAIVTEGDKFECPDNLMQINHVIYEHFLRQGMLDIAEHLCEDSTLDIEVTQRGPFLELHCILEALKHEDLDPALRWTEANREKLVAQNSSLEFKLHRLKFIDLVRKGPSCQLQALYYAKNFEPFAASHSKELQILMGTLLFLRSGLESSPYQALLDPIHWAEICDVFTRDACALLGLSVESPLSVVIQAGCQALPPLLTIKQVMHQRQCAGVWSAKDELPVEIDLGQETRFHSIFACPILRQQSTENNPPVRLICGHVISRDALNKLASNNKLKCPYCPIEQAPGDARQIYF